MKDSQHLEARLRRAKSCLNDVATSIEQSKCIDLAPEIAMSFFFAGLIDKYEIIAAQYSGEDIAVKAAEWLQNYIDDLEKEISDKEREMDDYAVSRRTAGDDFLIH